MKYQTTLASFFFVLCLSRAWSSDWVRNEDTWKSYRIYSSAGVLGEHAIGTFGKQDICEKRFDGELALPEDQEENDFIANLMKNQNVSQALIAPVNMFFNKEFSSLEWTNWSPSSYSRSGDCKMVVMEEEGYWYPVDCSERFNKIMCEKEHIGEKIGFYLGIVLAILVVLVCCCAAGIYFIIVLRRGGAPFTPRRNVW